MYFIKFMKIFRYNNANANSEGINQNLPRLHEHSSSKYVTKSLKKSVPSVSRTKWKKAESKEEPIMSSHVHSDLDSSPVKRKSINSDRSYMSESELPSLSELCNKSEISYFSRTGRRINTPPRFQDGTKSLSRSPIRNRTKPYTFKQTETAFASPITPYATKRSSKEDKFAYKTPTSNR